MISNQPSRWPWACLIKNETLVLYFQIASFKRFTFGAVAVKAPTTLEFFTPESAWPRAAFDH